MDYWSDTLKQYVQALNKEVGELNACTDATECQERLAECEQKLVQIKSAKSSYQAECRLLEDALTEQGYRTQLRTLEEQVVAAQGEMSRKRGELERQMLLADRKGEEGDIERSDNDQLLDKIEGKLDDIKESYERDEVYLEEIKVVGGEAVTKLRGQREQIMEITEKTQEIEDVLKRADILIRTFGRRMMTDRLIQMFALVNMLLLVGIIIYVIVTGANISDGIKSADNVPDASNV